MKFTAPFPSNELLLNKRFHAEKSCVCLKPMPRGSRAGTEVLHDEAWKEQVRKNKGIVLSIDGSQPDTGNETVYLMRDVLTGRILHAEKVTESTKARLKQILAPVVALKVPVLGVISD